jgi:hypothetical protein
VVNATSRPLYCRERPGTHCTSDSVIHYIYCGKTGLGVGTDVISDESFSKTKEISSSLCPSINNGRV